MKSSPRCTDMIKIEGLTPLQKELCDEIWSMDSQEELLAWVKLLPRSVLAQAWTMINMIIIESIDQEPIEDFTQAREVIDRVKGV